MKTLLVAALVLVGCGGAEDEAVTPVTPSQVVAPAEAVTPAALPSGISVADGLPADAIARACSVWADYGVDCTIRKGAAQIRFTNWPQACPVGPQAEVPAVGRGTPDGEVVLWGACLTDVTLLEHVAAHELGHVFGLQHVADENALMFWYSGSTAPTLDDADRAEWARVHPSP